MEPRPKTRLWVPFDEHHARANVCIDYLAGSSDRKRDGDIAASPCEGNVGGSCFLGARPSKKVLHPVPRKVPSASGTLR
jgi:hypothetical protein